MLPEYEQRGVGDTVVTTHKLFRSPCPRRASRPAQTVQLPKARLGTSREATRTNSTGAEPFVLSTVRYEVSSY